MRDGTQQFCATVNCKEHIQGFLGKISNQLTDDSFLRDMRDLFRREMRQRRETITRTTMIPASATMIRNQYW